MTLTAPAPDQIKAHRRALALTQAELADRLGVHPQTVEKWEAGTRTPPAYLQYALRYLEKQQTTEQVDAMIARLQQWRYPQSGG